MSWGWGLGAGLEVLEIRKLFTHVHSSPVKIIKMLKRFP